ncbi:hypothetical protein Y032_0793g2382 [Ancylostoma ceylanicum]|uniref:Uncharacterized protein n=1 Tax=Ancylostoma ceylanicum TaxID=53326 RepID=A0A016WCS1_9BILA|nr:hypothetical protein Y032_0793g2382 [Ancylostoma ceylanicum]
MNQNEPAIEELRIVEMIRIDRHVNRLERCQTELIAGTLEDVPTVKWRWLGFTKRQQRKPKLVSVIG